MIESVEKLARPEAPDTGALPDSVAPVVPVPGVIAIATFPANPAVLPNWSSTVTATLEMVPPAVALVGCVVIESAVAVAATVLNPVVVPAVKPVPAADSV